jgi:aconitate hydratase
VLPLVFANDADYDRLRKDDVLRAGNLRRTLKNGDEITFECRGPVATRHDLTPRQIEVILCGGLINWRRNLSRTVAPRNSRKRQ